MKWLKTYEGFFDFFKKKKSGDDEIAKTYIKRLEHLKSHLEKGNNSPYNILINTEGTEEGEQYYTRYMVKFDDSPIRISHVAADEKYSAGWNQESQKGFINDGAVEKNNRIFYRLYIENVDESVIADVSLLEELFELIDWCFKKNKENTRINKIKGDINPAADLLDDGIWGDLPINDR